MAQVQYITSVLDPRVPGPDGRDSDLPPAVERALQPWLKDDRHALYAVIDGAGAPNLRMMVEASGLEFCSLLQGGRDEELNEVAPLLIRLKPRHRVTRALFSRDGTPSPMWDRNCAILLISDAGIDGLRTHLRRMTMLRDDHGRWLYFRFFSPSTMHGLMPKLRDDPEFSRAFAGVTIKVAAYQLPLRNQLGLIDFGPDNGSGERLRVTPELTGAAARWTPVIAADRLRADVEHRLANEEPALHGEFMRLGRARRFGIAKNLMRTGITDVGQAAAVVSIMLVTGADLLREPGFWYATKNPFLSGSARARQLITAYVMISNAKG